MNYEIYTTISNGQISSVTFFCRYALKSKLKAIINTSVVMLITLLAACIFMPSSADAVQARLSAGKFHTLYLKSDGTVWSWGDNSFGQLGIGKSMPPPFIKQVELTNIIKIAAGDSYNLALKLDGTVWAWGQDYNNNSIFYPIQVPALDKIVDISNAGLLSVALKSDGTVWIWGSYLDGNYNLVDIGSQPIRVDEITNATLITSGSSNIVYRKQDGTVWNYMLPFSWQNQMIGLSDIIALSAKYNHCLALKSDGTVWSWGENIYGEVGIGPSRNYVSIPTQLTGLNNITEISTNRTYSMARSLDGSIWMWGEMFTGKNGESIKYGLTPSKSTLLFNSSSITAGVYHAAALNSDGDVWAWGNSEYDQLLVESRLSSDIPVKIQTNKTAKIVFYPPLQDAQPSGFIPFFTNIIGSYKCALDADIPIPCTSPFTYSNLTTGRHVLSISVTASDGGHYQPTTFEWEVNSSDTSQNQQMYLPKTGQKQCYSLSMNQIAPCAGSGQDGEYRAGVAWPEPRFVDNGNGTASDKLTGLMWSKDVNVMKTRDSNFDTDGTAGDGLVTWQHALDYIKKLNSEKYLGFGDWRLPNIIELRSLDAISLVNHFPAIESPNVATETSIFFGWLGAYWSSTSVSGSAERAYNNYHGQISSELKTSVLPVWPVRSFLSGFTTVRKTGQTSCYNSLGIPIDCYLSGQDGEIKSGIELPPIRFRDNPNSTITDMLTGLMWPKVSNTPGPETCLPSTEKMVSEFGTYISCLNSNNFLGFNDWRIPNILELGSLYDYESTSIDNYFLSAGFASPITMTCSSTINYSSNMIWVGTRGTGGWTSGGPIWPVRGGLSSVEKELLMIRSAPVAGVCGSDNAKILTTMAPTNLCDNSNPSGVSGNGHPWSWTCQGDVGTDPTPCSATIQTYSLSVTVPVVNGMGDVQANISSNEPSPLVLFCPKGDCSAQYDYWRTVRLTATPDPVSFFTSWEGACVADPCDIAMSGAKAVTAYFNRDYYFKNFNQNSTEDSLSALMSTVVADDEIRMLATGVPLGFFTLNKAVTLSGGWKALHLSLADERTTLNGTITVEDATSTIKNTVFKGALTVKSGKLKVDRVSIRPQ